jgi:hypothetical protein
MKSPSYEALLEELRLAVRALRADVNVLLERTKPLCPVCHGKGIVPIFGDGGRVPRFFPAPFAACPACRGTVTK